MKLMQRPMDNRRKHQCCNDQEAESGIQCIQTCEDLPCFCLGHIHWPHTTEQHSRIDKPIYQRQVFEARISNNADHKRDYEEEKRKEQVQHNASNKRTARDRTCGPWFVHGASYAAGRGDPTWSPETGETLSGRPKQAGPYVVALYRQVLLQTLNEDIG